MKLGAVRSHPKYLLNRKRFPRLFKHIHQKEV
jgi:hypothetical protein